MTGKLGMTHPDRVPLPVAAQFVGEPTDRCWRCSRRLEAVTDGDGHLVLSCPPCTAAYAKLERAKVRTVTRWKCGSCGTPIPSAGRCVPCIRKARQRAVEEARQRLAARPPIPEQFRASIEPPEPVAAPSPRPVRTRRARAGIRLARRAGSRPSPKRDAILAAFCVAQPPTIVGYCAATGTSQPYVQKVLHAAGLRGAVPPRRPQPVGITSAAVLAAFATGHRPRVVPMARQLGVSSTRIYQILAEHGIYLRKTVAA